MTEPFRITKTGAYKMRNGNKCEVTALGKKSCLALHEDGEEYKHGIDGAHPVSFYGIPVYDIISEWREPRTVPLPEVRFYKNDKEKRVMVTVDETSILGTDWKEIEGTRIKARVHVMKE